MSYPKPEIIQPKLAHKQSFIILHGRGDTAKSFGAFFLMGLTSVESDSRDGLQEIYPHAKFIFPTASQRRVARMNRASIHQWFDNWNITDQREKEYLTFAGLRETTNFLHDLIMNEVAAVGVENVVLWGLSQGCAASLIATILWTGEPIAACVGMCGWLPLRQMMEDFMAENVAHAVEGEDPFERDQTSNNSKEPVISDPSREVSNYLADTLGLDYSPAGMPLPFQKTPFFLGHGLEDGKVDPILSRNASSFLTRLNASVELKEYEGLGHWYSKAMLEDIITFFNNRTGISQRQGDAQMR